MPFPRQFCFSLLRFLSFLPYHSLPPLSLSLIFISLPSVASVSLNFLSSLQSQLLPWVMPPLASPKSTSWPAPPSTDSNAAAFPGHLPTPAFHMARLVFFFFFSPWYSSSSPPGCKLFRGKQYTLISFWIPSQTGRCFKKHLALVCLMQILNQQTSVQFSFLQG